LILPLISHQYTTIARPPSEHCAAKSWPWSLRGFPALPGDDEARTVVTARALIITARDSDTHSPVPRGWIARIGADR
jgi:hypothetical protein